MLNNISVTDEKGKNYTFSFQKPSSLKKLLTISLSEFLIAKRVLEKEIVQLGGDIDGAFFVFNEPNFGIVSIKVVNDDGYADINLQQQGVDADTTFGKEDIFLVK